MEGHLPCAGTGEKYKKEGMAKMCDEVITTHIFHLSVLFGRERRKLMSETELGKREQWEEGVLKFGLISNYPILI